MDIEPMEIDDAGNPIAVSLPLESLESTSGTEPNDSEITSIKPNSCPHCSRSLSPSSQSGSRIHPESLTITHVDWSDLRKNLNNALLNKFHRRPYFNVEVLLLTWAVNDLGPEIEQETDILCSVLKDDYHFQAEHHIIPSVNTGSKVQSLLATKIADLEDKSQSGRVLLIVYYNGHGAEKKDKLIWAARRKWNLNSKEYSALEWYVLQRMLEDANFDVLLMLDCYNAARAVTKGSNSTMEVLAGCGREVLSEGPKGSHPTGSPFTQTLIKYLRSSANSYQGLLMTELQSYMSLDEALKNQSPIHVILMGHYSPIILRKLSPNGESKPSGHQEQPRDFTTKVLLSISLRSDTLLVLEEWTQWLSSFHPPQVAGVQVEDVIKVPVKVEAAFPSSSTLLFLSVPVSIWARLQKHSAYSFIGFIKSSPPKLP